MPFNILPMGRHQVCLSVLIPGSNKQAEGLACHKDWMRDPGNLKGWLAFIKQHMDPQRDGDDPAKILLDLFPAHQEEVAKKLAAIANEESKTLPSGQRSDRPEQFQPFDDEDDDAN